ncbi:MAG: hypothetical protein V4584_01160 [Verrucomicrobiota bacterium]
MKSTNLLICAVAVGAAFAAVKANGQNLTATLSGIGPGLAVKGTLDNGTFHEYPAGVLDYTEFDAFCVEPLEALSYGQVVVYQIQDPLSLAQSATISRLVGGYLASARTDLDAAAVQWAIWETTNETLYSSSLLSGNVRIATPYSQNVATLGNQYLSNVNTFAPATLTYLTSAGHQDVVTWNVVPEPGSAGLAALSCLLLLRRRRR